jgi:hypothetical protein
VRLTIDPNNQVAETDEGNNTFDIPQSLTVIQQQPQQLDFNVTQGNIVGSASLSPGDTLRIGATISTTGPAGPTQIEVALTGTLAGRNMNFFVGPFAASMRIIEPFPIPNGFPPGTYTVRLTIDPNNQVAESDEGNNTFDIPQSLTIVTP